MLVLSRKVGQIIEIGDNIKVMVIGYDSRTGQVRLGITAPKNIPIVRQELLDKESSKAKR